MPRPTDEYLDTLTQNARDYIRELERELRLAREALLKNICPECEQIDEEDAWAAGGSDA